MNIKLIVTILAIDVAAALLVSLIVIKNSGDNQHDKDVSSIVDFSNQVVSADQHIDSLNQVNLSLTNDLMLSQQQAEQLSNTLDTAAATLASTKASLASMQDQVVTLTNQVATLNSQVADLQTQKHGTRPARWRAHQHDCPSERADCRYGKQASRGHHQQ